MPGHLKFYAFSHFFKLKLCLVSRLLLRKEGVNFRTTAEFEIVRTIKEKACYLAANPQKEETLDSERQSFVLPDGSTLEIGPARFRAPEVLFR